ncbi:hypothetical protein FC38_GL000468 [Lactobacillus gigeriorum DSM 23908 = CRBIP 24.85]|nr:hypothetical protein FC38_GL000468 [Lactobacillus gigeriorum DSM 23908 = CRBIP 24.85]
MSSSLIAEAIEDAGKKIGREVSVKATGTQHVADDLNDGNFDIVLLAPQSIYAKDQVEKDANASNLPFILIPRNLYNPFSGEKLLNLILEKLN